MANTKICTKCGRELAPCEFNKNKTKKDASNGLIKIQ